jgi:phosphatidate phosphatase PAH1
LGEQQMPPEVMQQFQQLQQQAQQASPEEAQNLSIQAGDILAQFSAPILAELLVEYNQKVAAPQDEDPLVAIRKQELALKGQELSIEQQQFLAAEQRKMQEAQQRMNVDRERIDTQEDIAELRNDTARARMEQQARFKLLDARNKNN